MYYERATLAPASRVVIYSYLYSGLRPSVRDKITSNNRNLRNLRYTKKSKYFSCDIGINNLRISVTDYPSRTVETMLPAQFRSLFTFSRKQQQIFIIYS